MRPERSGWEWGIGSCRPGFMAVVVVAKLDALIGSRAVRRACREVSKRFSGKNGVAAVRTQSSGSAGNDECPAVGCKPMGLPRRRAGAIQRVAGIISRQNLSNKLEPPMHVPLLLLSALALAPGDGGPSETQPSVVRLSCDFTHYPPKGNVGISLTQCDVAIFADEHPHLRLTTPEKSRFMMAFSLPGAPKTAFPGSGSPCQCRWSREMRIARLRRR